jgi:diguanylate cyclase (GGDEF)-like protein/PAS domain S-box-containing protein
MRLKAVASEIKELKLNPLKTGLTLLLAVLMLGALIPPIFADTNPVSGIPFDPGAGVSDVLFISSYHYGLEWTDDIVNGFRETLSSEYSGEVKVHNVYMDWKEYPTEKTKTILYEEIAYKYKDVSLKAVVVSDDAAFAFALNNRGTLFEGVPIVFCGVSEKSYQLLAENADNLTGVIEEVDIEQTVRLAKQLNPEMKVFYVVYDQTESGESMGTTAVAAIENMYPEIHVEAITDDTIEGVIRRVENVAATDSILLTAYYRDRTGRTIEYEEMARLISERSKAPVFSLYDFAMGSGVVGGTMLSGTLQGKHAAELTAKILNGTQAQDLPLIRTDLYEACLDYNALVRFGINVKTIPPDVEIINKPISIFEAHRTLIYSIILILIFLSVSVVALSIHSRRMRHLRDELAETNKTQKRYLDEIAASEEELRAQLETLNEFYDALQESEERNQLILDAVKDSVVDWAVKEGTVYFSERWNEALGYPMEKMNDLDFLESLMHPDDLEVYKMLLNKHRMEISDGFSMQCRIRARSGEYKWFLLRGTTRFDEDGIPYRTVMAYTDIDNIKNMENKLFFSAFHDELTHLPNKSALERDFKAEMEKGVSPLALLLADIDHFKRINDTMGHFFGDQYIAEIGRRLKLAIPEECNLYRIGGDEFIIFCKGLSVATVEKISKHVLQSLNQAVEVEYSIFTNSLSIGLAVYPHDGDTFEALMTKADLAMYKSKETGRSRITRYENYMFEKIIWRMEREKQLKDALKNNEFRLAYQPQMDCKDHSITGFEALIRWNNPVLGAVPPNDFIPIAEETQTIIPIGKWVIEEACRFIKSVERVWHIPYHISVNVSVLQLIQEDFESHLVRTLSKYDLQPEQFEIEITETVLIQALDESIEKLKRLRQRGIRVALDDFGTGYSSLSYLRELPIDTLKIDKSFIDAIGHSSEKEELVRAIIHIGHKMKLFVVAEGVETADQLTNLKRKNCDAVQGYYFSKPISEGDVADLIEEMRHKETM